MARTTTESTSQAAVVQYLDPKTLLVDLNIRHDARLTPDFTASIKEHGVLVPIVAVRTADGQVRVRMGHRRTLGAIETDQPTVPVIVAADETTTNAGEIERLVHQYAENEHRTGLSTAERADAVAQLAAFGVSAAQITKRIRVPRAEVEAALAVAKSDLARAAADRYDYLDLAQAATVAEFESDTEAVTALVAAAKTGQFDHVTQRLRDARAEREAFEAVAAPYREAGLSIIDRPDWRSETKRLQDLTDNPETREPLDPEAHTACPGHAAYLDEQWVDDEPTEADKADGETDAETDDEAEAEQNSEDDDDSPLYDADEQGGSYIWTPVYVCTEPERHARRWGGRADTTSPVTEARTAEEVEAEEAARKERARQERRTVIDNNKAARSAETVRREWVTRFLTRKTTPKGTGAFLAAALTHDTHVLTGQNARAQGYALLGIEEPGYGKETLAPVLSIASEARAQVLALGFALGAYEADTTVNDWRSKRSSVERYLRFLASQGYPLSEVERSACGEDPLPEDSEAA